MNEEIYPRINSEYLDMPVGQYLNAGIRVAQPIKEWCRENNIFSGKTSLEEYFIEVNGPRIGITIDDRKDGQTRYRIKTVEGTPGVLISKEEASKRVYANILKNIDIIRSRI